MSDTPRTDKLRTNPKGIISDWALEQFEQLELENQQLRDKLKSLTETHGTLLVALDYNRAERDQLREGLKLWREELGKIASCYRVVESQRIARAALLNVAQANKS